MFVKIKYRYIKPIKELNDNIMYIYLYYKKSDNEIFFIFLLYKTLINYKYVYHFYIRQIYIC